MRILIILLFLGAFFNAFCQNKETYLLSSQELQKNIKSYKKMRWFENAYEKEFSIDYEDSLIKYNRLWVSYISSDEFAHLDSIQLKEIAKLSGISINYSQDKKVKVVSWCTFTYSQNPICTNIMVYNKSKPFILSKNIASEEDFGENIKIDSIVDVKLQNNVYYVLLGANKCGNLCIQKTATLYTALNGQVRKCTKAFFDGNKYTDEVAFNYIINEYTKIEPGFLVKRSLLISPTFNKEKTKVLSSKTYKLLIK